MKTIDLPYEFSSPENEYATAEGIKAFVDARKEEQLRLITPGERLPHLWGAECPCFLLSKILASKGCIIRLVGIDGEYVAHVQVIQYDDGVRTKMLSLEIPPFRIPSVEELPLIRGSLKHADLIIAFQKDEDGKLKNPTWRTAISQIVWTRALETFVYYL